MRLEVERDKCGSLRVKAGEETVIVWYSYGRVYTVVNGAEHDPRPEDARLIARAFNAIAAYLHT